MGRCKKIAKGPGMSVFAEENKEECKFFMVFFYKVPTLTFLFHPLGYRKVFIVGL